MIKTRKEKTIEKPTKEKSKADIRETNDNDKSVIQTPNIPISVALDLDIDKFKNKIDMLLNDFKIEAVSELLVSKRNMLQENSKFIDSQRHNMQNETKIIENEVK